MFKEKLKASLIHLSISAFIIISFILVAFYIWYPSSYSELNGLGNILSLLIGVDLILGPMLTFVIFKKNKPSLKFDLTVIAMIQLAALSYGAIAVYKGHPVYVVFAGNRFELVSAADAKPENAQLNEFKVSTFGFPRVAYAKMPDDIQTRNDLLFSNDLEKHSEYYQPLNNNIDAIIKHSIEPAKLFTTEEKREKLNSFLGNKNVNNFVFLPLVGKEKDAVIAVNRKTGEIAGTIDVYPWLQG